MGDGLCEKFMELVGELFKRVAGFVVENNGVIGVCCR